jgi:hypothetical protein
MAPYRFSFPPSVLRMHPRRLLLFLLPLLLLTAPLAAQERDRPVPYPVDLPPPFERALSLETRTLSGTPGPTYWTNTASYTIDATLSPTTRTLRGTQTITYQNNAPEALPQLYVHLRQNLHREGMIRNREVEITDGMQVGRVAVNDHPLVEQPGRGAAGYRIDGTVMRIDLPEPLASGASVDVAIDWQFTVPRQAPRMGTENANEVFYLGYWYPQMAVYNDLEGWRAERYQGNGEFYMGFADYNVRLTLPEGWLVTATGELQNAADVLTDTVRERLATAAATAETVSIVGEDERAAGQSTTTDPTGTLTWHFTATQVRDMAVSASDRYVWDATTADTGAGTSMIHALYRPDAASWDRAAEFGQFAIEHLSEYFTPYPWPHMTAVEGIIGGGMEYPMMTLIGGDRTDPSLFGVTYHEIAHMWFPMIVSQDEKRFTWMDEGPVSFVTNEGRGAFFEQDAWQPRQQAYYRIAGSGLEVPAMRHGDEYPLGTRARAIASYSKPAVALHALRGLVGQEAFQEAFRTYIDRWAYKHPEPHDLFHTFNDVLDRDLDWFWRGLFYETWTLQHAIGEVDATADAVTVTIVDEGRLPMPAPVRITYADGRTEEQTAPVMPWLDGARTQTLTFPPGTVTRVTIDPDRFLPHLDRAPLTYTP